MSDLIRHALAGTEKAIRDQIGTVKAAVLSDFNKSLVLAKEDYLGSAFQLLFACLLVVFPSVVLVNLNKGLDVSDAGYYYNSIYAYADIDSTLTNFGVFWSVLPTGDSILINRFYVWLLLVVGGAFSALALWRYVWPEQDRPLQEKALIAAWGAGSSSLFYLNWLPDPSYNLVGLVITLYLLALAMVVARRVPAADVPRLVVGMSGFLIIGLAYVRPPTALIVGLCLGILVLSRRPGLETLLRIVIAAASGMLAGLVVLSLFAEPVWVTFERLFQATADREQFGYGFDAAIDRLSALGEAYQDQFAGNALAVLGTSLCLFAARAVPGRSWQAWAGRSVLWLGTTLSAAILMKPLVLGIIAAEGGAAEQIARTLFNFFCVAIIHIGLCLAFHRKGISLRIPTLIFLTATLFVFVHAMRFGSLSGSLQAFWIIGSYFALLAVGVGLTLGGGGFRASIGSVVSVALLLGLQLAAWQSARLYPYRLDAPLAAQLHPTEIRGGSSVLRLDERTRDLFVSLDDARDALGELEYRPILLDLSGGAPLVAYHLGFRLPGTAWIVGGYEWSQDYLEERLESLSATELCRAWILMAPESPRALDPAALASAGLVLEDRYEIVAEAYAPYPGARLYLYAPVDRRGGCPSSGSAP